MRSFTVASHDVIKNKPTTRVRGVDVLEAEGLSYGSTFCPARLSGATFHSSNDIFMTLLVSSYFMKSHIAITDLITHPLVWAGVSSHSLCSEILVWGVVDGSACGQHRISQSDMSAYPVRASAYHQLMDGSTVSLPLQLRLPICLLCRLVANLPQPIHFIAQAPRLCA